MKTTPTAATPRPTGVKSNMAKPCPVSLARKLAMMMLGGVPMSVVSPPRSVPKLSGMSSWLGGRPAA